MDFLRDVAYLDACALLEAHGYVPLADGDWARVFVAPGGAQVVRVTPFDPAYRVWAEMCRQHPHPNLARYDALVPLAGCGYAALMPRYAPGNLDESARFLADLQARLDRKDDDALCAALRAGLKDGYARVAYFAGLDDNPHNVLRDGDTPVLVDGFFQQGQRIHEAIEQGTEHFLSAPEREAFRQIPVFSRTEE